MTNSAVTTQKTLRNSIFAISDVIESIAMMLQGVGFIIKHFQITLRLNMLQYNYMKLFGYFLLKSVILTGLLIHSQRKCCKCQ